MCQENETQTKYTKLENGRYLGSKKLIENRHTTFRSCDKYAEEIIYIEDILVKPGFQPRTSTIIYLHK